MSTPLYSVFATVNVALMDRMTVADRDLIRFTPSSSRETYDAI